MHFKEIIAQYEAKPEPKQGAYYHVLEVKAEFKKRGIRISKQWINGYHFWMVEDQCFKTIDEAAERYLSQQVPCGT